MYNVKFPHILFIFIFLIEERNVFLLSI
jgi:hypothetical protein